MGDDELFSGFVNQTDPNVDQTDPGQDGLASPFLSNIPETDREIVAKYVKDWDAGVTKRFQSIHEQYAPFKDADPAQYQVAMDLYNGLNTDPMQLYQSIGQYLKENGLMGDENDLGQDDVDDLGDLSQDDWSTVPPALRKQFLQMSKQVETLNGQLNEKLQRDEMEKQIQQLDKTLDELHTRYGPFDRQAVLLRMRQGLSPEDAVKDYNKWVDELVSSRQKPQPKFPVLGGQGGSPVGQVDRSKLNDPKNRKALVAEILSANASS